MINRSVNQKLQSIRDFNREIDELFPRTAREPSVDFPDDILPFVLYRNTRRNIESIADQINKSFHNGIYDGCAVLMRRLVEMLLILAFKEFKREDSIRGKDDNYLQLSQIINKAISSSELDLTRNTKEWLQPFKKRFDLAAHNPFYNCTKKDLQNIQHEYRSLTEELLYKAGILK